MYGFTARAMLFFKETYLVFKTLGTKEGFPDVAPDKSMYTQVSHRAKMYFGGEPNTDCFYYIVAMHMLPSQKAQ